MGAPDSLCACRTGTWSRQWIAHPLRWLQQAATRPVPVNNGRIPSQPSEPITLDMTARERAWGSLAHVFLEGLIAADTPEVTDAGDPSSPARRGTVPEARPRRRHQGTSVQSITARTAHVDSAGAGPVSPSLPHPRLCLSCTSPMTVAIRPARCARHAPPFGARDQTSSATRPARAHEDGRLKTCRRGSPRRRV